MFLVAPGNPKSFQRAVQICSSYWGGKYFPIIPYYERFSKAFKISQNLFGISTKDFYHQLIENYSVDIIIYDEILKTEAIKALNLGKTVVRIDSIEESLINNDPKFGFGLHQIFATLLENEFKYLRNDQLKINLYDGSKKDLLSGVMIGELNNKYLDKIKTLFKFNDQIVTNDEYETILNNESGNYLNYLDIGSYEIFLNGNKNFEGRDVIFLIDPNSTADLMNFWNLRALGWNILAVWSSIIDLATTRKKVTSILKRYLNNDFNHLTVLGTEAEDEGEDVKRFKALLHEASNNTYNGYMFQWWIPRYWEDYNMRRADHVFAVGLSVKAIKHELTSEDYISIPVLKPTFMDNWYHSHIEPVYTNNLSLNIKSQSVDYVETFPRLKDEEAGRIIRGMGIWSVTSTGLNFHPNLHDSFIGFYLPLSETLVDHLFERKKLKIELSSAGKLAREVIKNIGGIYGTNLFFNETMINLLSLFESGKPVGKKAFFDNIQRNKSKFSFKAEPKTIVGRMLNNKMIRLGAEIECTFCNRASYYQVDEVNYKIKCKVCQNTFDLPAHNPDKIAWAYQGIGPFALNNKAEGIISVLLTLRFFKIALIGNNTCSCVLSSNILNGREVINEVDLILLYQGNWASNEYPDLIFCECKTHKDFALSDVNKMQKLGQQFPGAILLFATLKKHLSQPEKKLLKKLANSVRIGNSYRPINPMLILTGNELLPTNSFNVLEKLEKHKQNHAYHEDHTGHLCDMSIKEYLGLEFYRTIIEERYKKKWDRQKNSSTEVDV